jgi:hypothetical protein
LSGQTLGMQALGSSLLEFRLALITLLQVTKGTFVTTFRSARVVL